MSEVGKNKKNHYSNWCEKGEKNKIIVQILILSTINKIMVKVMTLLGAVKGKK